MRVTVAGAAGSRVLFADRLGLAGDAYAAAGAGKRAGDPDAVWLDLPSDLTSGPLEITVSTLAGETVVVSDPPDKLYAANCALVLHGNQGLGYSDVFHGRSADLEGSGFDEALQVHQGTGVPGNFHLSGPLQTAAEWAHNNGDPWTSTPGSPTARPRAGPAWSPPPTPSTSCPSCATR